ncbi:MAG: TlpA family protein disulfide reductase [Saprospiraceae bacterium]|nr:TlpA family protein disulfide reductase [Saprospiraceae bacterium]
MDRKLLPILARGLDGTEVNLENLKGHYTIVDLWATWCQPCIYAMPALGDIYDKYRYHGLKVVSISLDGEPASEKWKKMIDKENIYWDNYIMHEGFDSELCKQLNVKAIPHYILLDPEGRIMLENAPGPSDPNLTAVLDRLLMGKK